ncbi:Vacuolar fusion protein CCZ1-like protein [Colletotrichum orbiculare MAFF 240422]|uniref:Vacuolar fusion protein CCZ1-like protein n=1 Tax=Colletotrichum orbiculare (strain 104-T / ATCC 96160 / CBS 514.97 / LARS 414 / MAFF 240422) TaxID=1213857 RepID=N4VDU8_COLOR|nr:Vacuolar fusion protein CCZ1-like protein [Colletotrichum orbiculare MAFF 240422]
MASSPGGIVPAHLGFLAIFNPSLGNTDDTLDDQIVYYSSLSTQRQKRRQRSRSKPTENLSQEERNERLRQIGLAQGMVEFSKSFSGGQSVDSIDTERSRVVLHELEPGWWILASVDLTRIPLPPKLQTGKTLESPQEIVEFSSKEIKPAPLLLQDLLRAHTIFLLHHGTSLSALFVRTRRAKFLNLLSRYWDIYLSTWNVMLQGNPIRTMFSGINVAASGELGFGVGEEERGSGERDVLEGLVGRIEGLVDVVVSKFGSVDADGEPKDGNEVKKSWLGSGQDPGPEDGALFLGTGALSRKSVRDVAHWMEDLYTWGENAYGVIDSPTATRHIGRSTKKSISTPAPHSSEANPPRPPLRPKGSRSDSGSGSGGSSTSTKTLAERRGQEIGTVQEARRPGSGAGDTEPVLKEDGDGHLDKLMTYMKLGYGTYWSIGKSDASSSTDKSQLAARAAMHSADYSKSPFGKAPKPREAEDEVGHYLIGMMGDVDDVDTSEDGNDIPEDDAAESNNRIMLRTIHVELEKTGKSRSEADVVMDLGSLANEVTPLGANDVSSNPVFGHQDSNKATKLRIAVYVSKPFIFTFLFNLRTDSLAWGSFYKSLHRQLVPLRKPLLSSIQYRPERPEVKSAAASIYDLVWDAEAMTVHSSIPSIPDHAQMSQPNVQLAWTRAEAMNTHMQLLNIFNLTRPEMTQLERTCKTNRDWWVVWQRILDRQVSASTGPPPDDDDDDDEVPSESDVSLPTSGSGSSTQIPRKQSPQPPPRVSKEIFLIRRASDHAGYRGASSPFVESGTGWGDGAGRLASGIGIDTRRYIESLLNFGR